jgi:ABC-type nitrate/sulfonate/bicarbonate transport system substrate-binding protein
MLNRIVKIVGIVSVVALLSIGVLAQEDYAMLDEPTSVTIMLDWTPNTNHNGIYAAAAEGFYADANLEVEILEPADVSVEQSLDAGLVDFGVGFQDWSSFAIADGANVVSVAAIIQHNTSGFASIAANDPIESLEDLSQLTYGGYGLPDLENAFLNTLLSCDDLEWNTDNYLDVGFADPIELMERDRIDFSWIFFGWQGVAAELAGNELDGVMLMDYADCVPDYYTPILLTSGAMIDEQPEVVEAFVNATARGYAFSIENPEAAADILLEAAPELDADLVLESSIWLAEQYQADAERWGEQSLDVWQGLTDFFVEQGIIAEAFDVEGVFTNEFLPGGDM